MIPKDRLGIYPSIIKMYTIDNLPISTIAARTDYHRSTIFNILRDSGIPIKNPRKHNVPIIGNKILCWGCNKYLDRNLYSPSRLRDIDSGKRTTACCKECTKKRATEYYQEHRAEAITTIAHFHKIPIACIDCGYSKHIEIAHIGYINGGQQKKYFGGGNGFHNAIINGSVGLTELTLKCSNHNILDEFTSGIRTITSRSFILHEQVLDIIAVKNHIAKTCKCGEADIRLLTISHLNDDGFKDFGKNGKGAWATYYDIINGIRDTSDLGIECWNCQWK